MKYLLLLVFCFPHWLFSQNLLVNAGFENGLANWVSSSSNPSFVSVTVDHAISHSGNQSLRIRNNQDSVSAYGLVSQVLFLQKNGHYLLHWYVKTDSVISGSAFPYTISYLNAVRQYGEAGYAVNETGGEWKEYNYRFYMAQNSDTCQLLLAFGAVAGTAWFDDISLTSITDTSYNQFAVSMDSLTGAVIRPFTSTNVGPVDPVVSSLNLTSQFEQLGMEYVRTHDFQGPCDMHIIFPDTTRNALDSTAYNFFWTDSVIRGIVSSGCKVFFRLGESGTVDTALYDVPADLHKWAQVAAHIMRHYNQGWDHGFAYSIKYWEIFNEPDLGWNGTVSQYIALYRQAALALKEADSTLMIGGPAISALTNSGFLYPFLDSVKNEGLPFDFFSYHYYHTFNPYDFLRYDNYAKQILTSHDLASTPRVVSEWSNYNYNAANNYYVWRNDPFIAVSALSALSYYQNTDVYKLLRYRTDGNDLGMFDADGNYNFTGLAYYFMSNFRNAPLRLKTTGADTLGTSIVSAQSDNGELAATLIADNCSMAAGYDLSVNGIGATDEYNYSIFRIDSNISAVPVDSGIVTAANNHIHTQVKAPFADFIIMNKSVFSGTTSVNEPKDVYVYPNPFSDRLVINHGNEQSLITKICITDVLGRRIKDFHPWECNTGNVIIWNGHDECGRQVPPGVYCISVYRFGKVSTIRAIRLE